MSGDRAYISVIEWPAGFDEAARVRVLVAALGVDPPSAAQLSRRGVPQIVARVKAALAPALLDRFHAAGVTAFAAARSRMRAVADPLRAKRLAPALGAPEPLYMVEPWRGEGRALRMADVWLIVRATLRRREVRTAPDTSGNAGRMAGYAMVGAEYALIDAAARAGNSAVRSTSIASTEIIELHLADGSRVRIDADKFSFDVLGDRRGLTDRENAERLALRLAHEAPRAIIDTSFPAFRCPPEIVRTHYASIGEGALRSTTDAPAFDFYAVWVSLMYRAMMGG